MPEIPELNSRLADGNVELRPIAEWDIPEILIAHQDDPHLHVALGEPLAPSGAELGREVELAERRRLDGERFAMTILEPGHEYCRGRVFVRSIDWDAASARLIVWVAPAFRGRGFARSALRLVADWLFDQVAFARLELHVQADNEPMLRAGAGAGFRLVGGGETSTKTDGRVLLVACAARKRDIST